MSTWDIELDSFKDEFAVAVNKAFGFLATEQGFVACQVVLIDPHEPRDTAIVIRYKKERKAVDVCIVAVGLSLSVTLRKFSTNATCDVEQLAESIVALDTWWLSRQKNPVPPLRWMRKATFREEQLRSFTRYTKNVAADLEGAIEVLAERLRSSLEFLDQ